MNKGLFDYYAQRMNIIRFVAICSIVWGHSIYGLEQKSFSLLHGQVVQSILMQFGRIGTASFFLVTGFFISNKISQFTPLQYLRYRLHSVIIPWLVFLILYVFIQTIHTLSLKDLSDGKPIEHLKTIYELFKMFIFHGPFWFVPVSLLSSIILIIFKKSINTTWLGGTLLLITLFYGINLYYGWITVNHTRAFLGYTFFMWFGIQMKQHLYKFDAVIRRASWSSIITASLVFFCIACWESIKLQNTGCADPFGSIRISNVILSLLLFFALLKTKKMNWVNSLKPQENVYGIYLAHSVIITELLPITNSIVNYFDLYHHLEAFFLVQTVIYTVIITITYCIVIVMKKSPLYFMVGRKKM